MQNSAGRVEWQQIPTTWSGGVGGARLMYRLVAELLAVELLTAVVSKGVMH